jgi:hypothetical protein
LRGLEEKTSSALRALEKCFYEKDFYDATAAGLA